MNKLLFIVAAFVFLPGCSSKKEPPKPSIFTLKEMGKLATAEFIVTKVVRANDNKTWYKVGERKILISCKASVKAGVDFQQLTEESISLQENKISIRLPKPEIISFNLSPENIKVEFTEVGILRDPFTNAEIDGIMTQAEKQIRRQIDSLNILTTARDNAAVFVKNFFGQAGFDEVTVQFL